MERPGKTSYSCSFCNFKCAWESTLEVHLRNHTREKPFFCAECNREFAINSALKEHVQRVHRPKPIVQKKNYKCSLCPYATNAKPSLEDHTRRHTGERSYPCQHPNCKYTAQSSSCLYVHNTRKHTIKRKFKCPVSSCGFRGKTASDIYQHSVVHSDSRPFVCDFPGCNYQAKKRGTLKGHSVAVHHGGYKPFACSVCDYRTTSNSRLKDHQLKHKEEKSFKCSFEGCGSSFKTKKCLKGHTLRRHTEKTFKCDFAGCSSASVSRLRLEIHKKNVHYGYHEKLHKCPSCDFRAKHPSHLRRHVGRRHSSQQIQCPNKGCSFKARHQESLTRHMEHHKANLDCPVQDCGNVGRSSTPRKRHLRLCHPAGEPSRCPFCPQQFCTNASLSMHLKMHPKSNWYKCPVCQHGSVSKGNMMRHVRKIHPTAFPGFRCEKSSTTCGHCHVDFRSALGLAKHRVHVKTAVVVLTRLQLKFDG